VCVCGRQLINIKLRTVVTSRERQWDRNG